MAYLSLYRKYRSQDFEDVVGQQHVVQTLKNAITHDRLAHAYLFSGPRGTGKTSLARILAKALNCAEGLTAKPCLKCRMCENIKNGMSVDVIEIDAASNRGIDEIRQLREQVNFVPVEGRYKVYIIDEVHMLTPEAFNALLKTLEEPPAYTVFVLATTEVQKIPATILSRCQRLDLKRITAPEIVQHLQKIAKLENITIDEKSLNYIARTSDGCMRDAISLLDQLISYKGNLLNFDDILAVLGSSDSNVLASLVDIILTKNIEATLLQVEKLVLDGKNIIQLNKDMIDHFRNLLLVKAGALAAVDVSSDILKALQLQAGALSVADIKQLIMIFARADSDMRWHANSRLLFELAVLEACSLGEVQDIKSIPQAVITKKEKIVTAETSLPKFKELITPEKKTEAKSIINPIVEPIVKPAVIIPQPAPVPKNYASGKFGLAELKQSWMNVLNKVKFEKSGLNILLCESNPIEVRENTVILHFKDSFAFHRNKLMQPGNKADLEKILKDVYGLTLTIQAVLDSEGGLEKKVEKIPALGSVKKAPDRQTEQILNVFSGKVLNK